MPIPPTRARTVTVVAVVFCLAFSLRWLTITGLGSDDHFALWSASVFLQGDLPLRDFDDLGVPLFWASSALVQAIVGYRPVGEVLLGSLLVALGLTFSFRMAWAASGSLPIAAALGTIATLLVTATKLYSYPKMFLYPFGAWLCWRYIDKPSRANLMVLGLGVAIAFGYRHDHGAYIGLAAALAMAAAHWPDGPRRIATAWVGFGVVLFLLIAPFLAYVQLSQGLGFYFGERIRMAARMEVAARQAIRFSPNTPPPTRWFFVAPSPPARVQVEWRDDVSPELRTTLERRYSLTQGLSPKQQLYEYELTDVSAETLTALIAEPNATEVRDIPATVSIEWHAAADARRLAEFEQRYHLSNPRPDPDDPSGLARLYDIVDVSQANLLELATDAQMVKWSQPRSAMPATADPSATLPHTRIQWHEDLDDASRAELERKYGLKDATPGRNRWEYSLTDASRANIEALVAESHVYDTGLIDRETFRPMEETRWTVLRRALAPLRVSISPALFNAANTGAYLYYVVYSLPLLVLAGLAWARVRGTPLTTMPHEAAKLFVIAAMMAIANSALLRRLGYFPDHVGMAAVFGAWLLGRTAMAARGRSMSGILAGVAATAVIVGTLASTAAYASPAALIKSIRLDAGLTGPVMRGIQLFRSYSVSPPIDEYAPPNSVGGRALMRYVYECTRPDDRLWILSDLQTIPYYAERRILGHLFWDRNFLNTPAYEQKTLEHLEREHVPLIINASSAEPLGALEGYPQLHAYASRYYTNHYSVSEDNGTRIWVSTDNRRTPTGSYARLELPCFK